MSLKVREMSQGDASPKNPSAASILDLLYSSAACPTACSHSLGAQSDLFLGLRRLAKGSTEFCNGKLTEGKIVEHRRERENELTACGTAVKTKI